MILSYNTYVLFEVLYIKDANKAYRRVQPRYDTRCYGEVTQDATKFLHTRDYRGVTDWRLKGVMGIGRYRVPWK